MQNISYTGVCNQNVVLMEITHMAIQQSKCVLMTRQSKYQKGGPQTILNSPICVFVNGL